MVNEENATNGHAGDWRRTEFRGGGASAATLDENLVRILHAGPNHAADGGEQMYQARCPNGIKQSVISVCG